MTPVATRFRMIRSTLANHEDSIVKWLEESQSRGLIRTCNGTSRYLGCFELIDYKQPALRIASTEPTLTNTYYWHKECAAVHDLRPYMYTRQTIPYALWTQATEEKCSRFGAKYKILENFYDTIRTQKAQGMRVLQHVPFDTPPSILIQNAQDLRHLRGLMEIFNVDPGDRIWARPCPPRARHGFVDSRVVRTPRDIGMLWRETHREDPQAELLLQPYIHAITSAVLTPNTFTFGAGHDGATAGRNATVYRLGETKLRLYRNTTLKAAGIRSQKHAYIELVWEALHTPVFVQLRQGPAIQAVLDYVPRRMKVREIYRLNTTKDSYTVPNLLQWEKTAASLPVGTVVYHPKGGLSTHFGVHCVINKVAYFTTRLPHIGEVLTRDVAPETLNPAAVKAGIQLGLRWNPDDSEPVEGASKHYSDALLSSLFILHNISTDAGPQNAQLLGYASASLFRIMVMACLGEMRHFVRTHGNSDPVNWSEEKVAIYKDTLKYLRKTTHYDVERGQVYTEVWDWTLAQLLEGLTITTHSMLTHDWAPSMGGLNWGRCSLGTLRLYEAMAHVNKYPTQRAVRNLVLHMNRAVNFVHNNGSLFNKFADTSEINLATNLCRKVFLRSVFPVLYKVVNSTGPEAAPKYMPLRQWQRHIPIRLRKYADNIRSLKRCVDSSGDLEYYIQKSAARIIGEVILNVWRATSELAYDTVGFWIWQQWSKNDISVYCGYCNKLRHTFKNAREISSWSNGYTHEQFEALWCTKDCDGAENRQSNNQRRRDQHELNLRQWRVRAERAVKTWESPSGCIAERFLYDVKPDGSLDSHFGAYPTEKG